MLLSHEKLAFLFVVFSLFVLDPVHSQFVPPAKFDGFVYENRPVNKDTIVIDAFLDPVCPASRDSWPPLKQAVQHYGPRVGLTVHLFPLPYHDNAFVASRALHIVNRLNTSATFDLLEGFFKHQENFYNSPTRNMSRVSVVHHLAMFTAQVIGNSYHNAIHSGFDDHKSGHKARISFKYAASRGVYGTPSFFINGFFLPDAGSATNYTGWRSFIDPLLNGNQGSE
ncbi:hypothetical protein I3843_07G142800 [Carya illinoinensis]|nr:hypothetical protein I3843_07G142800 [Carya illinoinensis]